jgi:hypothetical protein
VTSVQAIYRMRSQQQRLHIRLPADTTFDAEPLRINGRPVTLEQGDLTKNIYSVPLVGESQDHAFLLELRYTVDRAGLRLECPVFPEDAGDPNVADEPAVQKVYLSVYLPQEQAYLGSAGPWTDEMVWAYNGGFSFRPRAIVTDESLIRWVSDGVGIDTASLRNFETDGHHYLFSTLRPVESAKGSLRVVALREAVLSVLVLLVVIGGGLALVRSRLVTKCLAAGEFIVALVLMVVFFPTLARHIFDGVLIASVFIVLVVWVLWWLVTAFSLRPPKNAAVPPPHSDVKGPDAGAGTTEGGSIHA